MYRVISENTYQKFISIEDKEGILSATSDWRLDGVGPRVDTFDGILDMWLNQNNDVLEKMKLSTEPIWVDISKPITQGIYLKSNNTFIGFSRSRFQLGKILVNEIVCIVPEYRGSNYLVESSILGLKTIFNTLEGNAIHTKVPIDKSSSSLPTTTKESDVQDTQLDRIEPITYKSTIYTREEWLVWIEKPENESIKNAPYEYIWNYTG